MFPRKVVSATRLILLKLRYGKRFRYKTLRQFIKADTEIIIGKNSLISLDKVSIKSNTQLLCDSFGELHIGSHVCINRNCTIACLQKIVIGDRCLFGPNVCIYDHDHAYTVDGVTQPKFKCSEIIIEDGCWIGAGVIILRGTHIGKNSVIEAGTVVRGIIPPNSLVTNAKEIRIIPTSLFEGKNVHCNNL